MVSQGFEPISLTFSSDSLQNKLFNVKKHAITHDMSVSALLKVSE